MNTCHNDASFSRERIDILEKLERRGRRGAWNTRWISLQRLLPHVRNKLYFNTQEQGVVSICSIVGRDPWFPRTDLVIRFACWIERGEWKESKVKDRWRCWVNAAASIMRSVYTFIRVERSKAWIIRGRWTSLRHRKRVESKRWNERSQVESGLSDNRETRRFQQPLRGIFTNNPDCLRTILEG